MSDDTIQITVNGQTLPARKGQMLIEVTDAAGIDIPRFCYHKKLSIAANCRMCLVEVEKAPKPLPACATPVMPDMVVHTQSELARNAQKGTMEFLLINHPLDCPICDQGGECELQDVALGYGEDSSQYTEGKRVVMDKYIGPLIATEMTRCIHCTRCVRFGEEIAGIRELGATGRGENVRIGTFIEKSVESEVSGNVIDVCPVGALTAKPSRFTARAWELSQHAGVSPHDSVGANIFIHTDKNEVNRVVPRENEQVNEVWIADRDRFAYQGLASVDRILQPRVRVDGELVETDWETALQKTTESLKAAGAKLSTLVSAYSSSEEMYLAQKLTRALGSDNIDHRLGQSDFSDQDSAPPMPWLGMELSDLESLDAALLVGSNIRKEQPIAALRLRKSALKGAKISLLNYAKAPLHFDALENLAASPGDFVPMLGAIAQAAGADIGDLRTAEMESAGVIADSLKESSKGVILLGSQAVQSPDFAVIRSLAAAISAATGASLVYLPEAGNTCGAWLSGCVPHRSAGCSAVAQAGRDARSILTDSSEALLLFNVEPELDAAEPAATKAALEQSSSVIAISSFMSDSLKANADVVLPLSVFTESAGTYVNASGRWQFSRGVTASAGGSRPGWKILRTIGSLLELNGFGFESPEEVRSELQKLCEDVQLDNSYSAGIQPLASKTSEGLVRTGANTLYSGEPIVRRATALQKTADARVYAAMSQATADSLGLADGDQVLAKQNGQSSDKLAVRVNDEIPDSCVWIPTGVKQASCLGQLNTSIELEKV